MVRRMKAKFTQIESVVTPSGNSGHAVVPKAWIGKEAIVTLKEKESRTKAKKAFY
jgi:putative transposon-encoded protein